MGTPSQVTSSKDLGRNHPRDRDLEEAPKMEDLKSEEARPSCPRCPRARSRHGRWPYFGRVCFSCTRFTLLGAKGLATRSKDATRGSWPYY